MHCNGHCKLAEMNHSQNEEKATRILQQLESEVLFVHKLPVSQAVNLDREDQSDIHPIAHYQALISSQHPLKTIKPPELSVA